MEAYSGAGVFVLVLVFVLLGFTFVAESEAAEALLSEEGASTLSTGRLTVTETRSVTTTVPGGASSSRLGTST